MRQAGEQARWRAEAAMRNHTHPSWRQAVEPVVEALESRSLLSVDLTGVFAGGVPAVFSVLKANKVSVKVMNQGDVLARGSVTVSLYASADTTLDGADTALLPAVTRRVSIKPGKAAAFSLKVPTPATITDGNYYLLAEVQPGGDIVDGNTANNVAVTSGTSLIRKPFVDLTGQVVRIKPTAITIGLRAKPASVTVKVLNSGNIKAVGFSTMSIYASANTSWDTGDTLLTTTTAKKISIAPGKVKSFTVSGQLPSDTPSGTFYAIARVNANGGVAESDTSNNFAVSGTQMTIVNAGRPPGPSLNGSLQSDVEKVVVGSPELVHFSASVAGAGTGTAMEVDEYDGSGTLIGKITSLRDDGNHATGDQTAGDGVFTGSTVVDFNAVGTRNFVARLSDPALPSDKTSATLSIPGVVAPTGGQISVDQQTASNADQAGDGVLDAGGTPAAALNAVAGRLASDPNVVPGSIASDGKAITWKTTSGITEGYSTDFQLDGENLGGTGFDPAPQLMVPFAAANPDPTLTVLILSPFHASLAGDPSAGIQTMFENANYTVTYHQDAFVNFNAFKNLDQYNAVELYGHGTTLPNAGEGFYTSIAPTVDVSLNNIADLLLGRIVVMNDYYVITPRFIGRYAGDMNGTIVLANCCNSAHDDVMANAFLNNGAAAYLGYTETVRASFATSKANATWTTLLGPDPNNKVGDIPGVNVDHSVNVPPAYFVSRGDINATLPKPTLLQNVEVRVHYTWPETQRDLDTNTTFLGASAGWRLGGGDYLSWTGDDTSNGGAETCTIDVGQAFTDRKWTTSTTFTAGADWYGPAQGSGPALLTVALEDKTTGVLFQGITKVIQPGTETSGASTIVGSFSLVVGGSPAAPSVKLTMAG